MRGFAALMVVLIHTSGRTEYSWLGFHGYGPIALFVLSGFLLYRPWARWVMGVADRPSVRAFALRRGFRIFPAYWVVFLVWAAAYPAAFPGSARQWVEDLTLLSSLEFFALPSGLEQVWSLGVELSWYLALPFVGLAVFAFVRSVPDRARHAAHLAALGVSVLVSVAWTVWVHHERLVDERLWLPRYLWCFALGAFIGMLMEADRARIPLLPRVRAAMGHPWLMLVGAVVFTAVGVSSLAGPHTVGIRTTLTESFVRTLCSMGLAGTLLAASVFGGPGSPIVRFMSTRFMQAMGRWSYGIYLWHLPLIVVLWEDFSFPSGVTGLVVWLLAVVAVSVVLGALTFAWVEQPTMDWSRKLASRYEPRQPSRGGKRAAGREIPSVSSRA